MSQLFNVIKATNKADNPPDYMKGITAKQLIAYYFNWHPEQAQATEEEIEAWYLNKRGWTWEPA